MFYWEKIVPVLPSRKTVVTSSKYILILQYVGTNRTKLRSLKQRNWGPFRYVHEV